MRASRIAMACAVALTLFCATTAKAEPCEVIMRKGQVKEDLTKILNCLNDRLTALEAKVDALSAYAAAGELASGPTTYDNGLFKISVRGYSSSRGYLNISIRITNLSEHNLLLAFDQTRPPSLVDETNGNYYAINNYGNSVPALEENGITQSEGSYAVIQANGFMSTSLCFYHGGVLTEHQGSELALHIAFLGLIDSQVKIYAVPLIVTLK